MNEDFKLINNKEDKQYEFHIEHYVPKIEYIIKKDTIVYLTHTEVPHALKGKGVGTQLVKKVLEDIDENEMLVVPLCPFVASYMTRHPEWKRLLMEGITIGR